MKIVFFGDSISAGGRDISDGADLGTGYVKIAAGKLRLFYHELELAVLNRGVDGDRTQQLLERLQEDVIDETPDIVVLEAGINDVWHKFLLGVDVSAEQFRINYEELVTRIKQTGATLLIVQPYALNIGDKQRLRPRLNEFNSIIREIATREKVTLVPMDEIFTGVTQDIKPTQFSTDGIHPTHRGCRYIADGVIRELKKIIK